MKYFSVLTVVLLLLSFSFLYIFISCSSTQPEDADNGEENCENGNDASDQTFTWTKISDNTGWINRSAHTCLVFNDNIWVLGGFYFDVDADQGYYLNDVWYSADGNNWGIATENAGWIARTGHSSTVFAGKMWVFGGLYRNQGRNYLNDIWSSEDGITWTQVVEEAPWHKRSGHTTVIFDSKIWIIGGYYVDENRVVVQLNDVWHSDDGITWTQVSEEAPWHARASHSSVICDSKIWIIGGDYYQDEQWIPMNDVWHSDDGITWTQATDNAPWQARQSHQSVAYDGKIYLIGGDDEQVRYNDIWTSSDGITWEKLADSSDWDVRKRHRCFVFQDKIWLIGGVGVGTDYYGDVWVYGR